MRDRLSELSAKITSSKRQPDLSILKRPCPVPAQQAFCRKLAEAIGFDFNRGRIDVSAHPFTTGLGPGRHPHHHPFRGNQLRERLLLAPCTRPATASMTRACPPTWTFTARPAPRRFPWASTSPNPACGKTWWDAAWPFWNFFFPELKKAFPGTFDDLTVEQFHFAINHSAPSFIRTESDEVTYNLHVCLRYEIETDLLGGKTEDHRCAGPWNELMKKYLGITPPNDAQGCLQDVHWSHGSFGYFPTYTLGNLFSAQFFEAAEKEIGPFGGKFEQGDFKQLKEWLNKKIHAKGQTYLAGDLCLKVTGKELSPEPFLKYLEGKFGPLYGF